MDILLNKAYGGFSLPKSFTEQYPQFAASKYVWGDDLEVRSEPALIKAWQKYAADGGDTEDIKVVGIPNSYTDIELDEYDGWESVTFVVNGKLCHA